MASPLLNLPSWRQLRALIWKNLLTIVIRHPITFPLRAYVIPVAILVLLLYIPSFVTDSNVYGVGDPRPLIRLADAIPPSKPLMIVRLPNLASDADHAITALTSSLAPDSFRVVDNEDIISTDCVANVRGLSPCFAAITLQDTPLTVGEGRNHTWNYTLWMEPARQGWRYNVHDANNDHEKIYMPLQVAWENAITNGSVNPSAMFYTSFDQAEREDQLRQNRAQLVAAVYPFALFGVFFWAATHMTTVISKERETGLSHLIDAMGGSPTARVLSNLVVFDILYFPSWIVFGALYAVLLAPDSNPGVLILWQILLGLAVNHSTLFAAAWFKKARASAIYVLLVFMALSVGTQVYSWDRKVASPAGTMALSFLFPSSNHIFFTQLVGTFQYLRQPVDLSALPNENRFDFATDNSATGGLLLGFLVIGIVLYPIGAVLVEHGMHGISFRGRTFADGKSAEPSSSGATAVVETVDLEKRYQPSWTERIFCCGRRKSNLAVDGVSLQGHGGQILCLVGPNGSGKTTTLQMMAGMVPLTKGSVKINALPTQVGICPQSNTLWDELTVEEHVAIWNQIKAGTDDKPELDALVAACDLEAKNKSRAGTLSGGQKRKLQLACMFVGDSTVCLIDECTSGLDPLSRRVIWEILMAQRAKRSIIFTTHFLDEVEVLADHIVILTKGRVRCHGPSTELKSLHGGGYKVLAPRSAVTSAPQIPGFDLTAYPSEVHQDRLVYTTPDSRTAAQLTKAFAAAGIADVTISGPQVEDVFLRVADEPELQASLAAHASQAGMELTPGEITSFWAQVKALLWKRLRVLRRFWWPYLYVLALPLGIAPALQQTLYQYEAPSCANIVPELGYRSQYAISYYEYDSWYYGFSSSPKLVVGPPSAEEALRFITVENDFAVADRFNKSLFGNWTRDVPSERQFVDLIHSDPGNSSQGIWMDPNSRGNEGTIIAFNGQWGVSNALSAVNLWSQMHSRTEIVGHLGQFGMIRSRSSNVGVMYAIAFALVQALYPAAFAIYPAMEKARKVRSLEYANGVRRGPLWVAYSLFDSAFILAISIGITAIISAQIPYWNGSIGLMFPILLFYGIAAMLVGYIISHFAKSPLAAFMWTMLWTLVGYAVVGITLALGDTFTDVSNVDNINIALTFSLNIIFPIGSIFRAMFVGFNINEVTCHNGQLRPSGDILAFGGPILYLVIQTFAFLGILIWLESARNPMPRFKKRHGIATTATAVGKDRDAVDAEKNSGEYVSSEEVEKERSRVEVADNDLLRILHLTKTFGSNVAVEDVTLGLGESDVMALIGPNGAGKSTLVNLIRGDLYPDSGSVFLKGEDAYTPSAQKYLGVCPQYDALDLLSTAEHLAFYAKIKGIPDVTANVNTIMARLGLTEHATKLASKLSGGNKRKLSLAIALIGTPPVLVLDEPTSAMDAVAKRSFWRIIQEVTPGRSLLLTTHSMEEADALANRAAIISRRLLAVGTTQALRQKYSDVYYVQLLLKSAPYSTHEEMAALREWVQDAIPGANLEREMLGGQIRFTVPGALQGGVAGLIEMLEREKEERGVEYYSIGGATLERVFLSVVKENNVAEQDETPKRRAWKLW